MTHYCSRIYNWILKTWHRRISRAHITSGSIISRGNIEWKVRSDPTTQTVWHKFISSRSLQGKQRNDHALNTILILNSKWKKVLSYMKKGKQDTKLGSQERSWQLPKGFGNCRFWDISWKIETDLVSISIIRGSISHWQGTK